MSCQNRSIGFFPLSHSLFIAFHFLDVVVPIDWSALTKLHLIKHNISVHNLDQPHLGNCKGLPISHVCSISIRTPCSSLQLFNVLLLHVPSITKSLHFVYRLNKYNGIFFQFIPHIFLPSIRSLRGFCFASKKNDCDLYKPP